MPTKTVRIRWLQHQVLRCPYLMVLITQVTTKQYTNLSSHQRNRITFGGVGITHDFRPPLIPSGECAGPRVQGRVIKNLHHHTEGGYPLRRRRDPPAWLIARENHMHCKIPTTKPSCESHWMEKHIHNRASTKKNKCSADPQVSSCHQAKCSLRKGKHFTFWH